MNLSVCALSINSSCFAIIEQIYKYLEYPHRGVGGVGWDGVIDICMVLAWLPRCGSDFDFANGRVTTI